MVLSLKLLEGGSLLNMFWLQLFSAERIGPSYFVCQMFQVEPNMYTFVRYWAQLLDSHRVTHNCTGCIKIEQKVIY